MFFILPFLALYLGHIQDFENFPEQSRLVLRFPAYCVYFQLVPVLREGVVVNEQMPYLARCFVHEARRNHKYFVHCNKLWSCAACRILLVTKLPSLIDSALQPRISEIHLSAFWMPTTQLFCTVNDGNLNHFGCISEYLPKMERSFTRWSNIYLQRTITLQRAVCLTSLNHTDTFLARL